MARDKDTIKAWLIDLGPRWLFGGREAEPDDGTPLKIANLLASSLARVLARAEEDLEDWMDELFRLTASEGFLEDHGRDNGIPRHPWEDVEVYRAVCALQPRGATPAWIKREIDRLFPTDGYDVRHFEPHWLVALPGDASGDELEAGLYAGDFVAVPDDLHRLIWLEVPVPELVYVDESHAGAFYAGDAHVDSTPMGDRRRFFLELDRTMERLHPHGCGWGYAVRDRVEPMHFDQFFSMQGAVA